MCFANISSTFSQYQNTFDTYHLSVVTGKLAKIWNNFKVDRKIISLLLGLGFQCTFFFFWNVLPDALKATNVFHVPTSCTNHKIILGILYFVGHFFYVFNAFFTFLGNYWPISRTIITNNLSSLKYKQVLYVIEIISISNITSGNSVLN